MNFDYDVVIIGGAFSGAATALMLKRKRPEARVLIIEKNAEFDRKVGESTTEVSSCYMTRILGLTHYLGHLRPNTEHPINAVWARFSGVKEWDSYEWRERFPAYANGCRTAREWATNHLFGRGWWVWIIPLQGGDVSAGIVYDSRIFKLPEGRSLGQRLHDHILSNPVGREIFGAARVIEGDVHALSMLPYHSEKVCGDGWAAVGDAAGFIDPLYSPGLDFCSYTSYYVADLIAHSLAGEDVADRLHYYNQQYPITYRYWFESLYKDKYYYMGDAELMSAALLLDVSSYYLGLVRATYRAPESAFLNLPFGGIGGRFAAGAMKFYNRRLVALAKRRWATGYYARRNSGWHDLYDGFVPDARIRTQIWHGLRRWWKCELINLGLMLRTRSEVPTSQTS